MIIISGEDDIQKDLIHKKAAVFIPRMGKRSQWDPIESEEYANELLDYLFYRSIMNDKNQKKNEENLSKRAPQSQMKVLHPRMG